MKSLFLFFLLTSMAFAVNLNPGECQNDSLSNITYCGQLMPAGIIIQLNYSEQCLFLQEPARGYCLQANPPILNYSNSTLGIIVYAPPFPAINQTINQWANSSSNNFSAWGLYENCYADVLQKNNTLIQTVVPIFNQLVSLGYNQSWYNESMNLTITTPLPPNFGINKKFDYGECYENNAFGVRLCCGDLNLSGAIFYGQQAHEGMYCMNYSKTLNCTKLYSFQTENGTQQVCFDQLANFCTPEEILGNNPLGCYERNFLGLKTNAENLNTQLL